MDVIAARPRSDPKALHPGGNAKSRIREIEPNGAESKAFSDVEWHRAVELVPWKGLLGGWEKCRVEENGRWLGG